MSAELLRFEDAQHKRLANSITKAFGGMYEQAADVAHEYATLMSQDPRAAILQLPVYLNRARDINPERSFVEAVANGPNPDWTAPMLDIIGVAYPTLDKETRKEALLQCLGFLNGLRYDYSQMQVELINEPWLVADIVIDYPLYWCGFQDYCELLEKNRAWEQLYPQLNGIRSAFWFTLAIVRTEFASDTIKDNFYRLFPTLTDRTLDAIAGITHDHAEHNFKKDGTPLEEGIEKRLFKYDHRFHADIKRKIEERKWITL